MRNPDWNREELILALDLYFQMDYGQMHGRNSEIIKLSDDLRRLNLHANIPDKKKIQKSK
jgi:5-methylcytosine-specific restriction enzyme A